MLEGKKTYITAVVGIVAAWCGVYLGNVDVTTAIEITYQGLLASFVRKGVAGV